MRCRVEWEERNRWGRRREGRYNGKAIVFLRCEKLAVFYEPEFIKFENGRKKIPPLGQFLRILRATAFSCLFFSFASSLGSNFHTLPGACYFVVCGIMLLWLPEQCECFWCL